MWDAGAIERIGKYHLQILQEFMNGSFNIVKLFKMTCTLQNDLYSKRWGFSCLFYDKIPSCKNYLKKRLGKVIPHFKNAVIQKGACQDCGDWWTDLSNKKRWFPKHKDYAIVKDIREGNGNEENNNIPKAPGERPANEENLLSPCKISFRFLSKALKYAWYHFENKLWEKVKHRSIWEHVAFQRMCCQCY